ncbi:peroxiredoxin-like family protein [Prolixibacter sp. NT017]|uniref:peroxiredoxin-like family protein n=1 Tax=Prolixibacter sp. NT017 TaxID=2652390 RepID=UPI0012860137|nr:peroxiredoxin-like family protein [Prolixibacter sp. NT017]GET24400.1 hypothetical protein NT017_07290 [Prolixibacter sp. NT017]
MEKIQFKKIKEAKGLQPGETVKDFSAVDLNDNVFTLSEALKKGPVVVIFYRGQWCPFCNKHLKTLEQNLDKIYEKGASVIAISPEKSEFLKRTADKTKASFSLLFDEDYKIAEAFDVAFRPTKFERTVYNKILKADMKNAHSDDSEQLPIPATFIIGTDSKIIWRHFDPDYKKRSKVDDIVKNIP